MDIAVIGYNTSIGQRLKKQLCAKGYVVREINREHLFKLAPKQMGEWLGGCKAVVDVTSTPYISKWTGKYQYSLYADRLASIRAITTALKYSEEKPSMLLTLSNCMVYDKYEVHDDYSTQYDDGFMAEVGEMELRETLKVEEVAKDARVVLLRTGYVMDKDSPAFKVLKNFNMLGIGGIIDDGYQCLPMIHEIDLVNIIEHFIDSDREQGIFNVTIPHMASMNEMTESIRKYVSTPQVSLPKWLLRLIMGRAISMLEQNCKVMPYRLTQMGYMFMYPDVETVMMKCFTDLKKKKKN